MWYVIQVMAGREEYILSFCEQVVRKSSEEMFVMRCDRLLRNQDGSWRKNEEIAFPGYLFADTDDIDGLRERLKKIPELAKVVKVGTGIFPIYDGEEKLFELMGGKEHLIKASTGIRKGDKIVVLEGSLVGHEALIKWVNSHKRLAEIELDLAGEKIKTKVGLEILKKID